MQQVEQFLAKLPKPLK